MSITRKLADETFYVMDGKTKPYKIVPQIASSLRTDLIFWQAYSRSSAKTDLIVSQLF